MSLNRVTLIGYLGQDPELRLLAASGQPVANFSVATDEVFTDKEANRHERVDWHHIVVYGRAAETCKEYLKTGRQVVCCESFIEDGGGPPGVGLQEQIPNHPKLRG